MQKWMITAKRADFAAIARTFQIDPVIVRLIRNRDVIGDDQIRQYLKGGLKDLHSPWELKDMKLAVSILLEKIREKKPIRIIGDYDIDGVTATTILTKGLRRLGADVDVKIPHRITDGYGINESLVREAYEDGRDTILTCDNGIAAKTQVDLAKSLGMTVVITDHHEVPYEESGDGSRRYLVPEADAVINPKQVDCFYPFSGLCGAVVAWKLILALYEARGIDPVEGFEFLELCAFATIGDVMDLKGENRILVKEGLRQMHHTKNPGLRALIRAQGIMPEQVTSYHIGFVLGPCINASGRLDTAERALKLLLTEDETEAASIAGDLVALNDSRKDLTRQGEEAAILAVEESDLKEDRVLVVYLPDVHESLAGIIAGRLKEHFHKPSFVLTRSAEGIKGSGRSIESYSMYEELVKVKEYLTKFGGHPMAAGISLKDEETVEAFRKAINASCSLTDDQLVEKVRIDVAMPVSYISQKLVKELELLEPFGKGNEKPLFAEKNLSVQNCRVFGKNRNVAKMRVRNEQGYTMDAVYFGDADGFAAYAAEHPIMMMAYYPVIDSWNGRSTLQITIRYYQ